MRYLVIDGHNPAVTALKNSVTAQPYAQDSGNVQHCILLVAHKRGDTRNNGLQLVMRQPCEIS